MIVATYGLGKAYGSTQALSEVDLAVPAGSVYGLVGPNGAGKTTLLAILAGLRRPTGGRTEIGVPADRIGVLPDTPRFEKWLTAREVVELSATLSSAPEVDDVDAVLAAAGLEGESSRLVGGYSRGMLQRLGLAATVVAKPQLLLLDEPAAALDPAGRREVLDLVAALRGQATVILSSHILDDVQEVCDQVGILRRGELVYQGEVAQLLSGRSGDSYLVTLRSGMDEATAMLLKQPWVAGVAPVDDRTLRVAVESLTAAEAGIVPILGTTKARVISLQPEEPSLEQVFLELTS